MNTYKIFYKYTDKEQGNIPEYTEVDASSVKDAENYFWDLNLYEDLENLEILKIEPLEVIHVILTDNDFAKLKDGKTVYQCEKDIEIRISKEHDLRF
jgi:hypothetical protein